MILPLYSGILNVSKNRYKKNCFIMNKLICIVVILRMKSWKMNLLFHQTIIFNSFSRFDIWQLFDSKNEKSPFRLANSKLVRPSTESESFYLTTRLLHLSTNKNRERAALPFPDNFSVCIVRGWRIVEICSSHIVMG